MATRKIKKNLTGKPFTKATAKKAAKSRWNRYERPVGK